MDINFEYRNVNELIPYVRNARTHSEEQVAKLAGSIKEFGFINPVVISDDGGVLAGHGRIMAARKLGIDRVPCVVESHLTEAQKRAYILADNRLALDAGWNEELLAVELKELKDGNFDLDVVGFSPDEIDAYTQEIIDDIDDEEPIDDRNLFQDKIQYEPTGADVNLDDLVDKDKYFELVKEIDNSNISEEAKSFLRIAATRHIVFNYKNIAEYYAGKATAEEQGLFERSALVILDFQNALKNGFVKLTNRLDIARRRKNEQE